MSEGVKGQSDKVSYAGVCFLFPVDTTVFDICSLNLRGSPYLTGYLARGYARIVAD